MSNDPLIRYGATTQELEFSADVAAYARKLNDSVRAAADSMEQLPDPAGYLVLLQQYADARGNDE